ncbi:MAG: hypothetical protein HN341_16625 [Verrucomicrobia bacterium]|jgi:hypothetical protein|nr:hypothetical protein [Verrucomicrobiota bacterium]
MTKEVQEETKEARRHVRRQRRRRVVTGLNVVVAVFLMAAAVILLNLLVSRFPYRLQLRSSSHVALSERTLGLLKGLQSDVTVTAFLASEESLYDQVRVLLHEYAYVASRLDGVTLNLEIVDPNRDIARTRALAQNYDVATEDVVVFSCGGRTKHVVIKDLAEYEVQLTEAGIVRNLIGFFGEQAFSSAILSVTQEHTPVVYFVSGHGERDIEDFGRQGGYSSIARAIRHDNMEVRRLLLAEHGAVPDDCAALIVAGPDQKLSEIEIRCIQDYLKNGHGRVMFLLDPSVDTGLAPLLDEWGVGLGSGVAAGLTLSGHELIVASYGKHPITHAFDNVTTMFYMPRPVITTESAQDENNGSGEEDRARVTVLAATGPEGWVETDLSQDPPRYDEGTDRRGVVSVAVAVEKGLVGVDVELQPTRVVVVGDSYFVSNAALSGGVGGNVSFFLSSLNWLVERDCLLAIAPRPPQELRLEMSQPQWTQVFLLTVVLVPGCIALLGFCVWLRRRR